MLCSNRPEGFGPSSTLASPLPTSCFNDVILIPLPVWIYMTSLPILVGITIHYRRRHHPSSIPHIHHVVKRSIYRTIVTTIFYLLMIANILMQVLEIVRLELLHYDIGLLPFAFVGILLVFSTHLFATIRRRFLPYHLMAANTLLWIGLMVMCIIKTIALGIEEGNGFTRKQTVYPINDQLIDVGVMAGVYAVLANLEVVIGFWREKDLEARLLAEANDSVEAARMVDVKASTDAQSHGGEEERTPL